MPDPELERLIGPGLEPTDDFVSSLRERVAEEWRGARPTRAKRRHWVRVAIAAAAVVALVGGAIALFGRDTHQSVGPAVSTTTTVDASDLRRVATIVFDEPTDAWVSGSESVSSDDATSSDSPGRHVLYRRGSGWFVGFYDEQGFVDEAPVNSVPEQSDHQLSWSRRPDGSELLLIDGYPYRRTATGWQQGERIPVDSMGPPTLAVDPSTPQRWMVAFGKEQWAVPAPSGWNVRPPTLLPVAVQPGEVTVALAAQAGPDSVFWLLGPGGDVRGNWLQGSWSLLDSSAEELTISTVDPARRDYSVERANWTTLLSGPPGVAPAEASGVRWAVTEFEGNRVERSPMPWFTIDRDGTVRGFDGCVAYLSIDDESAGATSACVPMRPDVRVLKADTQLAELVGNDFRATGLVGAWNTWQNGGRFTVAGSGSSVTFAPDGWLSVGSCANVAIWQNPELVGDLTITPVDGASLDAGCGAPDVMALLAEPKLQLLSEWLSSDATALQLHDAPEIGRVQFGFGIGSATLLDGAPLSSTAEIVTFPGGVGATMTPSGRIFVSFAGDDGWSVQEYVAGEFLPTGLVGLASGVFSGAGEDLYVRENEALVVFSETDTGWVQRETIPAEGECYLRRTAFETECGARAAITPPSEVTGVRVTGKSVELWSEGRSLVYEAEVEEGGEINCESDVCLSEYTYIPGGGAVWASDFYPSVGEAAAVAAVLRPGLEPVVVTFGPITESNDTTIIGVIGDVIHVLRWTGDSYRLESFQLPSAGPGPTFEP